MSESEYTGPAEGDSGYGSPGELGELLKRRDAEQVLADRDRMVGEITTELARVVPARCGCHTAPRTAHRVAISGPPTAGSISVASM